MKRDKTGKFAPAWTGERKQAVKLSLTSTAWQLLEQRAQRLGISRSELVERYGRQADCSCGLSHTIGQNNDKVSTPASIAAIPNAEQQLERLLAEQTTLQQANTQLHTQIAELQQTIEVLRSQQQQAKAQTNEQQWLEAVLNLLPTPLILVDSEQRQITFSNQAANAIAGVDLANAPEAIHNPDVYCTDATGQFIPPNQLPTVRAAQGEQIRDIEINWHTSAGVFPLLVNADTLPAMHDRPATSVMVFQNIRQRKQLEDQLRESQRFIQQIADATPGILYTYDLSEQRNIYINRQIGEVLGYTSEHVQAMGSQLFPMLMHPDDLATLPAHMQRFDRAQDGEVIEREYRMRHANGEWRWLWSRDLVFARTQTGTPRQVLGISHDITDRKQAELSLQQTEERLQLALSSTRMLAWDMDLQTQQVVCSPSALKIWGIQAGTAEDFFRNVHPDDRQGLTEAVERAKAGEESYLQEYRVLSPDQTIRWLNSQGQVYFDETGQATRMVGVSIDISDRKHAEIAAVKSADRTARLQTITAALSEALTPVDVATVIVEQALAALGGCRGLVMLLNASGEELELIGAVGYDSDTLSAWQRFPVTSDLPLAHAIQTQTPIFLASLNEAIASYPQLASLQERIKSGAIAAIPLIAENQVLGSLGIGFAKPHQINEDDRTFILTLAHQCAQAIRRAQLYEAEQAARANAEASEKRFRFLAESIPQMVWVARPDGFTEYYNQRWFQYTGLTLEASQNANGSFRHPDDHERCQEAWIKASTHKDIFQVEQRLRRFDGTYRWHLTRAHPLLDANGEIVKWFGSCTDIDDWKRMEQIQRFLAQASQTFVAASLNLQAVLDTVTRLASELTHDVCVLHLLADDRQSLDHASFYHPDSDIRAFVGNLLHQYPRRLNEGLGGQVMQTGEPILMPVTSQEELSAAIKPEYRIYLERFQIRSTLLVPLKVQGQPIGVLSLTRHAPADPHTQDDLNLFQDLADRAAMAITNAKLYQQAEQARQQAEQTAERNARLQSITAILSEQLTPAQVAAVIVEQSQAVLHAAAALVAIVCENGTELEIIHAVGYQQDLVEQWRRFPIAIAAPMTDAMRTGEIIWESSGEERAARYPHLAKAYARYNFTAWMSLPLVVEGRAVGGITLSFTETPSLQAEDRAFFLAITQQCAQAIARAQLYEAEKSARSQAEAANRMKDEFLAVLSHELRTPMNPVLGWTRLLQQGNLDTSRTTSALATIERNAKLQIQLIEDLLDISSILQGKLSLNPHPVNLVSTIDAAIETVRLAADVKGIEIRFTAEGAEGVGETERIVSSLSSSAPSTPSAPPQVLGDAARLQQVVWNLLSNAVKFTPNQGQIEIQLTTMGLQAQVQVKDTGKGIHSAFLPYVFDTFRQADSSITRTFGGLGLGLAIARHIVELHGGTIQADSPGEGQGATFTVRLPLLPTSIVPAQEATLANNTLTLQGIQVLAVDDEIDNLELATFILEQAGASVVAVSSAQEALQRFHQTKPDIVIADIGMPQMDGYTLLQQIRTLESEQGDRQIPAIALTAYASEMDQQQALAAGFQQHIPKPVEPEALLQAILGLLYSSQ